MALDNPSRTLPKIESVDLEIGKKLKTLRRHADKTQADIASYLDISPQQYQKYEKGASKCNVSNLYKLAKYYDRDVSDLLPGAVKKNTDGFQEQERQFEHSLNTKVLDDEAEAMAQLLAVFVRIPSKTMRRKILNLLSDMFQ